MNNLPNEIIVEIAIQDPKVYFVLRKVSKHIRNIIANKKNI